MVVHMPAVSASPRSRVLAAFLILAAFVGCRKPEPVVAPTKTADAPKAGAQDPQIGSAVALAAPASAAAAPLPDFGITYGAFVQAHTLERCALLYHEDPMVAESLAVDNLMGKPFVPNLEHVFDAAPKPGARVKPPAVRPDTAEQLEARNKYHHAVLLADVHTATQVTMAAILKDCVYARELGLVPVDLIDRYIATFVEVACLQRQFTDADGKTDPTGHANAAADVFNRNRMSAGEMARLGMVFGRLPKIQIKLHEVKAKRCPDPRVAAEQLRVTGEWTGQLAGDRNASLNVRGNAGTLGGSVQWLGATVKQADGASEAQAIAVQGQISGTKLTLFGEGNGDWIRLEGTRTGDSFSGSWQAQRGPVDKFKGTWSAEKAPQLPVAATASGN